MGKDTKYLTVALIVLCAIAALIVNIYPDNKAKKSENVHAETDVESIEKKADDDFQITKPKNSGTLYADNTSSPDNGNTSSYNELFSDKKVATVDDVPAKTVATTTPSNVPAAYEEKTKKIVADKLTEKGATKNTTVKPASPKKVEEKNIDADKLHGFLVITNQFGSRDNAMKEANALKGKGYPNANVISLDNKVFMSYAGKMDNKEDAQKLLNQLKKKGFKPMIKDLN